MPAAFACLQSLDLPPDELDAYRDTCDEAIGLAMLGRTPAALAALSSGLVRARRLAARGTLWAPALAQRYAATLARFRKRYGVPGSAV
jgi:hypothetical protein